MTESNILRAFILVSEKAANIARAIRHEDHLLSLLVREKKNDEKNPRFLHDFKTLADVLVQEVVKHDLGTEFPELVGHIYGEESNEFSCLDGENVNLKVGNCEKETFDQLLKILGDEKAASSLASLVHSTVDLPDLKLPVSVPNLPLDELGIWIDPIDSTAEYISGGQVTSCVEGVFSSGLPCVTVLIGAFHQGSRQPVLGVVNQPFHKLCDDKWEGSVIWGVSYGNINLSALPSSFASGEKVVVVSSTEASEVKDRLVGGGYRLVEAAGAGYKLLCVASAAVSAYVLSKPSTFYWDTCAAHAILAARGGGVVDYAKALSRDRDLAPLEYRGGVGTAQCCNCGGFIAYSSQEVLDEIVDLLINLGDPDPNGDRFTSV